MILRPVRPQSPAGPPITNLPVGLMWYLVPLCSHFAGSTGFRTCSRTASIRSFCLTDGSCWVDSTTQHDPSVKQKDLIEAVREHVLKPVLPAKWLHKGTKYHINPTGKFVIGGPAGDCGLTGRKIIVDTYGGWARHGCGAFSGKDPSKVDRSAAYAARYVAKNIVAADIADRCEVQVSYAIGVAEPTYIMVETFGP